MTDKPVEQHPPGHSFSASFIKDIESVGISRSTLNQTSHNGRHHQDSRVYHHDQTVLQGDIYNIYAPPLRPITSNHAGDNCRLPSRTNACNQRTGTGEPIHKREMPQSSFHGSPHTLGPFLRDDRRSRHELGPTEAANNVIDGFNARIPQPSLQNNQHMQSINPMFMDHTQQYQNYLNWPYYSFPVPFFPLTYVVNPVYLPWILFSMSPPFIPTHTVPDLEPDAQGTSQSDKHKRRRKRGKKQEPHRRKPS